jgi:hypothetical protein
MEEIKQRDMIAELGELPSTPNNLDSYPLTDVSMLWRLSKIAPQSLKDSNQEACVLLVSKCGVLESFVNVIVKMHTNIEILTSVGKSKAIDSSTSGWR